MTSSEAKTLAALATLRESIDEVDRGIIDLMARRGELACSISEHKASLGRPVEDPARETKAIADRCRWAAERSVDPHFIRLFFESVLLWSRTLQTKARLDKQS